MHCQWAQLPIGRRLSDTRIPESRIPRRIPKQILQNFGLTPPHEYLIYSYLSSTRPVSMRSSE